MIKLQILWIYLDAGSGKYMDPLGGWTFNADPLPALDTYTRHTVPARYMYALLGPFGMRLLTPVVVWVELLCAPICLIGSYFMYDKVVLSMIAVICFLHIGIAFTLRNTVLLSLVGELFGYSSDQVSARIIFRRFRDLQNNICECLVMYLTVSHPCYTNSPPLKN